MSTPEYKIEVAPKEGVLVIEHREGEALKLRDPNKIDIKGDLNAPKTFFDCRSEQFPVLQSYCHCTATPSLLSVQLVGDDRQVDRIVVTGLGKANPEIDVFRLGDERGHTIDQLVKILRRKRHMFPNPDLYQKLLNSLTNFKAKVDSTIASAKDTKGNVSQSLEKIVHTEVPENFMIEVQPYLSGPKQMVLVETEVTSTTDFVTVALYAFGLDNIKKDCAVAVFDEVTDTIKDAGIPVIHDIQF